MLDTLNFFLFWACLYFLLWNAYILIFNRGVPNIRTAKACRKKICAILQEKFDDKEGITIADLGSGNGQFARDLARALPHSQIIGYEISKLSIAKSKILTALCGIKNINYIRADFFDTDLAHLDGIVFFLSAYEISRMGEILNEKVKPDALIISNRFALKDGWEPAKTYQVKTLAPKQGAIHVYRT